jgi:hypothetical protein
MGKVRAVFMVSDQCWQDVLSLVPIAIRPGETRRLPVLIYHQEGDAIDVDATLHFLDSYLSSNEGGRSDALVVHVGDLSLGVQPTLVKVLEEHCGIGRNQIRQISPIWRLQQLYQDVRTGVIIARDDYQTGLIAAPFAALQRAHLCFLDAETLRGYEAFLGGLGTIYLVGQLDGQVCDFLDSLSSTQIHRMTSEQVRREYAEQVQTDKIILVNPDDLGLYYEEPNSTLLERTSGEIRYLYGGCSLVAPFLAAAKQEVIMPTRCTDWQAIDALLYEAITDWKPEPRFLTIVASPEAIPMSIPAEGERKGRVEVDGRCYSSKQNWGGMDLAVGRIFGITVSDCSAYVARVLFFEELERPRECRALFVSLQVTRTTLNRDGSARIERLFSREAMERHLSAHCWTAEVRKLFDSCSFVCGSNRVLRKSDEDDIERCYPEASLILYTGHASSEGFALAMNTSKLVRMAKQGTYLDGFPVIFGVGCRTGAYALVKAAIEAANNLDGNKPRLANLFVAQNIRRGAMAQQCSVGDAYWHDEFDDLLRAVYVEEHPIGEAIQIAKNSERSLFNGKEGGLDNFTDYKYDGDPHYLLVGDPTFVPTDHL